MSVRARVGNAVCPTYVLTLVLSLCTGYVLRQYEGFDHVHWWVGNAKVTGK